MSSQKAISMKKLLQVSLFAIISVILTSCKSDNQFTETITPTITSTDTPTPTIEPSEEVTSTPTPTKEPTKEPTDTPTVIPTIEPTNTPVPTNSPTPTFTPVPTNTPIPSFTPTPTVENKPTTEPTTVPTATPTEAPQPTVEPTATPTEAPKPTEEVKPTPTEIPVPQPWEAPRERKDIADLLMAKVQAYRASKGIRKFENPYTYYDVNIPNIGNILDSNGLRVAKASCLAHSANHEGGQIGAGVYGGEYQNPAGAEEMANRLYMLWYNSPGHNANMLTNHAKYDMVDVAVMTVVEYFDGYSYQYCAIMSNSTVLYEALPEGLN